MNKQGKPVQHTPLEISLDNPELIIEDRLAAYLPGHYGARVHDLECELELHLDATGCLAGAFVGDGERLEIIGGIPNIYGEVFGLIRDPDGGTLAVFRAARERDALVVEVDLPGEGDLMGLSNAERVVFRRLDQGATDARALEGQSG